MLHDDFSLDGTLYLKRSVIETIRCISSDLINVRRAVSSMQLIAGGYRKTSSSGLSGPWLSNGQGPGPNRRRLLAHCARAYMHQLGRQSGRLADWVRALLTRRHSNVVTCALANRLARTAWALATLHTTFDAGRAPCLPSTQFHYTPLPKLIYLGLRPLKFDDVNGTPARRTTHKTNWRPTPRAF